NTGVGWRNIIEKMHMTATLTKRYEEHGRHEIFAGNKNVSLGGKVELTRLKLKDEIVTNEVQHDLDKLGIAKTAREEKTRARNAKMADEAAHNEKMARLYREVVLKEKKQENFVPLGALGGGNGSNGNGANGNDHKPAEREVEPVAGD